MSPRGRGGGACIEKWRIGELMSWTVQCSYAATAPADLSASSDAAVTYDPQSGSLQMAFEVEAGTLEEAAVTGMSGR